MNTFRSICLISIVLLLASCGEHIIYHSYHHFPSKRWDKNDSISLKMSVPDSIPGDCQPFFLVRNHSKYPYQDVSVLVCHNFPDTTSWRTDTLRFTLADEEGKWKGAGWGGLYQSSLPLSGKARISYPSNYTFKVTHLMSDEVLHGINDIGVLVEKEK